MGAGEIRCATGRGVRPIVVERFGTTMREKLTWGGEAFREACLGALIKLALTQRT